MANSDVDMINTQTVDQNILNQTRLILLVIVISMILLFFPPSILAGTLYVPQQFSTIQDAVRVAEPGETILVAPGEYKLFFENLTIINESLIIKSEKGPQVTAISGRGSQPVITIDGNSKVVINGFTITARSVAGGEPSSQGGGIYCAPGSSPTIINNIITRNISSFGGAIYCDTQSSPQIRSNLFLKNKALISGGGIFSHNSASTIVGNRFQENETGNSGGAIAAYRDASLITNNVIWQNKARFGGGISCDLAGSVITNNTIVGNHADYGGGIVVDKGSVRLANLILWNNKAADLFFKQTTPSTRPIPSNI